VIQALVAWLAEAADRGKNAGSPVPTWRIGENRWAACRDGVEGEFADVRSGERHAVRECLHTLFDRLEPFADRLGASAHFEHARILVERNGSMRQRAVAAEVGARGLADWLAQRFSDGLHG
jgi:glutamate---cysteine ligase / carboxylate-amine ligase